MKKMILIICGVIIVIGLIPIVLYCRFAFGMIVNSNPNKEHPVGLAEQYKTAVKKDFAYIKDVKVTYEHGISHYDFTVDPKMSIDEYKQVIIKIKELTEEHSTVSRALSGGYGITARFDSKKDIYFFESSYWIEPQNTTNNPTINNFKIWYLKINNEPQIKMEI